MILNIFLVVNLLRYASLLFTIHLIRILRTEKKKKKEIDGVFALEIKIVC